ALPFRRSAIGTTIAVDSWEAEVLYPIQNSVRNVLDISGIWDFKTDPDGIGEAHGWANGLEGARPMAVPGSWNEQYDDLFGYLDLAWYVKKVYVPSGWRGQRVFLRVGSAVYFATVYVNGVKVGTHEGGHLPFAFEITDRVRWGEENVIAISVENVLRPDRVPSGNMPGSDMSLFASTPKTTYDFYPFAGIHRPVVLYSVPQTYIADVTVVTTIEPQAAVRVTVKLNAPVAGIGTVQLRGGDDVYKADLAFTDGVAETTLTVPDARLWSDKDPYLYDLTVKTEEDEYSLKVGIRTIAVRGGQILLNGQPVKLNGFGRHEDFIASGKGLNLPLLVKDYQLMKWTGANAYRTSHYPYSEEEMQLADREGFLIIDEIPAVSLQMADEANFPARLRMCLQQIEELIARDKNHPAVVMWCVANEPMPRGFGVGTLGESDPALEAINMPGKQFLDTLLARARELDPTRPVTLVTVMGGPQNWMENCDVICMNRYWGWYTLGGQLDIARQKLEAELDQVWERFHKPIILTEFGADTIAGYHGKPDLMWTEEYQAQYIRLHLEVAAARDFIAGMQVWNFADFAAVQSVMRVGGLNHKGVFTRIRTPKMAAHVLREFWVR
ncbi:MAG: beta-glucuronidase, partial [Anaerolineae bacterium]|nr:beta-glucuronidase [Anaerolineae bacterium]